jgi:Transposase
VTNDDALYPENPPLYRRQFVIGPRFVDGFPASKRVSLVDDERVEERASTAPVRQGPALRQGPEVHAALQPREPDPGGPPEPQEAALGQQAPEHRLLKESFAQLWSQEREGWARRFFENWRASLKWQRLKPYEKFAEMIDRHWDGIAAYCQPENKVSLGFFEGLNNKIRAIQRRAYGLRDEEYLRLKILTCMLPAR